MPKATIATLAWLEIKLPCLALANYPDVGKSKVLHRLALTADRRCLLLDSKHKAENWENFRKLGGKGGPACLLVADAFAVAVETTRKTYHSKTSQKEFAKPASANSLYNLFAEALAVAFPEWPTKVSPELFQLLQETWPTNPGDRHFRNDPIK